MASLNSQIMRSLRTCSWHWMAPRSQAKIVITSSTGPRTALRGIKTLQAAKVVKEVVVVQCLDKEVLVLVDQAAQEWTRQKWAALACLGVKALDKWVATQTLWAVSKQAVLLLSHKQLRTKQAVKLRFMSAILTRMLTTRCFLQLSRRTSRVAMTLKL